MGRHKGRKMHFHRAISVTKKGLTSRGNPKNFYFLLECGHWRMMWFTPDVRANVIVLKLIVPTRITCRELSIENFPKMHCRECARGDKHIFPENFLESYVKQTRGGFKPHVCEMCGRIVLSRFAVHSQGDSSNPKGWRWICCECLGHKSLSCVDDKR